MTGTTEGPQAPALMDPSKPVYRLFWILSSGILVLDQLSKWIIVSWSGFARGLYPPFGGVEVIPGFFNLVYTVNYGAAWGMFAGFGWLLVILGFTVLALLFVFRKDIGLDQTPHQACIGLITGGIVGNTLDRMFRGHVVDFLDFHLPWYRWPTFNVADSAIVVGTLWYIYLQFAQGPPQAEKKASPRGNA